MASEFFFDLEKTAIHQVIKWEKHSAFMFLGLLKKLFFFLFLFLFLIFLFGFFIGDFSNSALSRFLGLAILSLVLFLTYWLREIFLNSKLRQPKLNITIKEALSKPKEVNLAEFLNYQSARAVFKSIQFVRTKKLSEISSTLLFYNLISDNPNLNFIFSRILIDLKHIKKLLKDYLNKIPRYRDKSEDIKYKKDFLETIFESLKIAQKKNHQRVETGDILSVLAKHDLIFKKIIIDANLKIEDIENLTWWMESIQNRIAQRKRFWEWNNLIRKGSLAKEWSAGYTINLDRFSIDITESIKKNPVEVIGHEKEIKITERILSRREINNCLLVGEPGVGRKSIIWELAKRGLFGASSPGVNYKRVVQLDLASLTAQIDNMEEMETVLDKIFQEVVYAGNVILVIDEFHNFIGVKEKLGVIDISGILGSYLHLPQFQIVAVTNYAGLHKYIEQKPSILALFEKVEVAEISEKESLMILENLTLFLEQRYKKFITFPALRETISLAKRYLPDVPLPKSAMDLLDEVLVQISTTKDRVVLPKHVTQIVSQKTEIPVGEVQVRERQILLNLEDLFHQRIINQNEAVNEVSAALRRARAEITVRKKPMGTFLFLGPTGVGKTETSKALSAIYFGSEEKMIRLDMSEFQNVTDIPRLLGSPGEEGLLTTRVKEDPFSLILLDEIEKAHPNILNLFLQVLDEGFLTDGLGRKINFKESIIIATSNAGYKIILEAIKQKTVWSRVKQKLLDHLFKLSIFRPEFINRFDAVVIFRPLSKENLLDIADLMLSKIKDNLKGKNIEFIITELLKEKIVELGYDPTFGARHMKRVIQDKVENVLASAILSNKIKRGDRVEVKAEDFKLLIHNN